jgi:hypothetical protein
MEKIIVTVSAVLMLATGCYRAGPIPAGTELDCYADGKGNAVNCEVDTDGPKLRSGTSTKPTTKPPTKPAIPTRKTTTKPTPKNT